MKEKIVTILAIDDNTDNLGVLEGLLSEAFPWAMLHTATSGKKGIEMCGVLKPDVVLLDIAMPGMDGFEVCSVLKSDPQLSHIPVVMVTAVSATTKTRIQALEAGADAFLAKPIDESELTAQVRAMLRIKSSEDQKNSEKERLEILVQQRTIELERELLERRKAESALQQSVQKLEKSMAVEINLTSDLRNEIAMRKSAELQVMEHLHDQQIITEASKALVSINSSNDVIKYIGESIYGTLDNCMLFTTMHDPANQSIHICHSFGLEDAYHKAKALTGLDAQAHVVYLTDYTPDKIATKYINGKPTEKLSDKSKQVQDDYIKKHTENYNIEADKLVNGVYKIYKNKDGGVHIKGENTNEKGMVYTQFKDLTNDQKKYLEGQITRRATVKTKKALKFELGEIEKEED